MLKWFEQVDNDPSNAVYSRVRLARNWEDYAFPPKLSDEDGTEMIKRLEYGLKDLKEVDGRKYEYAYLNELKDLDRMALRERRILNKATAEKKGPSGLIISEDESASLVLNGDDHLRFQVLLPGLKLEECSRLADQMDDYINERLPIVLTINTAT